MRHTNYPEIISRFRKSGFSETELAKRVESTQPTINRIRNGVHVMPDYDTGVNLVKEFTKEYPMLSIPTISDAEYQRRKLSRKRKSAA